MPRLPEITTTKLTLEAPYVGFWLFIRDDPEMSVYEDVMANDVTRVLTALAEMTTSSNAVNKKGESVDLTTIDGWRRQRRTFVEEVVTKIKEAWSLPKASRNGSQTSSPSAEELSPVHTP